MSDGAKIVTHDDDDHTVLVPISVLKELEEMARASLSYCQDGSLSTRRRMAMIHGAQEALRHAKPYIGDKP